MRLIIQIRAKGTQSIPGCDICHGECCGELEGEEKFGIEANVPYVLKGFRFDDLFWENAIEGIIWTVVEQVLLKHDCENVQSMTGTIRYCDDDEETYGIDYEITDSADPFGGYEINRKP